MTSAAVAFSCAVFASLCGRRSRRPCRAQRALLRRRCCTRVPLQWSLFGVRTRWHHARAARTPPTLCDSAALQTAAVGAVALRAGRGDALDGRYVGAAAAAAAAAPAQRRTDDARAPVTRWRHGSDSDAAAAPTAGWQRLRRCQRRARRDLVAAGASNEVPSTRSCFGGVPALRGLGSGRTGAAAAGAAAAGQWCETSRSRCTRACATGGTRRASSGVTRVRRCHDTQQRDAALHALRFTAVPVALRVAPARIVVPTSCQPRATCARCV